MPSRTQSPCSPPPPPAAAPPKPRLFVLAAGINKYVAPAPQLDLAVTDAKSFVAAVRQGAKPLYREVDAYELYDDQATADGIGKALDDIAAKAESSDVLLVYLSGHGEQVDKRLLLHHPGFPHAVRG